MLVYCFLSIGLIFHLECLPVCWFIQRCVLANTPYFVSESSLDLLVTHKPYPWLHNHIPLIHYSLFLYQNSLFMSTIQTCLFIFSVFPQSLWSLIYLTVTSGSYVWLSILSPMCIQTYHFILFDLLYGKVSKFFTNKISVFFRIQAVLIVQTFHYCED